MNARKLKFIGIAICLICLCVVVIGGALQISVDKICGLGFFIGIALIVVGFGYRNQ